MGQRILTAVKLVLRKGLSLQIVDKPCSNICLALTFQMYRCDRVLQGVQVGITVDGVFNSLVCCLGNVLFTDRVKLAKDQSIVWIVTTIFPFLTVNWKLFY